jgi:uncharacterized protein (TIGR02001 family)
MFGLRNLVTAAALSAAVALPALAADPTGPFGGNIAGTVGLFSDYKFRGISQTSNNPAFQGSLEYSVPVAGDAAALYASVWGSNVNFFGAQSLELDWTGGVRGTIMGIGYDLNVIYYSYPGGVEDLNYVEPGIKLSYDLGFAVPYVGARYSPDFQGAARIANNLNSFARTGHAEYYTAGVTVPLPFLADYSPVLAGEIGHQSISNNALWGTPDYTTWTVGLSATAYTLAFGLQYVGSNLSLAECFGGTNVCDDRVVFSVSKSF